MTIISKKFAKELCPAQIEINDSPSRGRDWYTVILLDENDKIVQIVEPKKESSR